MSFSDTHTVRLVQLHQAMKAFTDRGALPGSVHINGITLVWMASHGLNICFEKTGVHLYSSGNRFHTADVNPGEAVPSISRMLNKHTTGNPKTLALQVMSDWLGIEN